MKPSSLESKFMLFWKACKGPVLQSEVTLVPGRKFRCDFYHEPSRTIFELEGLNGRHQRIKGFMDDAEKYLLLALLDYRVIRLVSRQITVPVIEKLIEWIGK